MRGRGWPISWPGFTFRIHHLQPARSPTRGFEARALAKFLERGGVVRRTCSSSRETMYRETPPQNRGGDREKRFRENRQIILPPSGDWQNVSEQKGKGEGGGRHDNHKIFAGFGSKGREGIRGDGRLLPGSLFRLRRKRCFVRPPRSEAP